MTAILDLAALLDFLNGLNVKASQLCHAQVKSNKIMVENGGHLEQRPQHHKEAIFISKRFWDVVWRSQTYDQIPKSPQLDQENIFIITFLLNRIT